MDTSAKLASSGVVSTVLSRYTSRNQKIIICTVTLGIALVGFMARYFRRHRAPIKNAASNSPPDLRNESSLHSGSTLTGLSTSHTPNTRRRIRPLSSVSSIITQSTLVSNSIDNQGQFTCTQLGVLGLETLEKSIQFWEESYNLLKTNAEALPEDDRRNPDETMEHIEKILDTAYSLQRLTEELFLHENSVLYGDSERMSYRLKSVSSIESFLSAEDFLSDDEDITMSLQAAGFDTLARGDGIYPLFEAALRLVQAGAVPYRSLKTEMVGCTQDHEYLAKLHCLRGAFSRIVSDVDKRKWIAAKGKEVLMEIMVKADKDPKEFELSFDTMVAWAQEPGNWGLTESELKDRGLRALTFYDIVLDFIFLDAFEDLEAPPASVLAVTQNRWLSNSFKETALSTAVWSVLKTKRRWLRYSDGFIAHFYDLSEHIMPTLAWGFLGPPSLIQDLCTFFKDKFLEFLQALYSFDKVRYSTLDDLAKDVIVRMEEMHSLVMQRLEEAQLPPAPE